MTWLTAFFRSYSGISKIQVGDTEYRPASLQSMINIYLFLRDSMNRTHVFRNRLGALDFKKPFPRPLYDYNHLTELVPKAGQGG